MIISLKRGFRWKWSTGSGIWTVNQDDHSVWWERFKESCESEDQINTELEYTNGC